MLRFSRSRPTSGGASSADVRYFFPLFDARSSSISSSTSARWCPWTAAYSSSSSAGPESRRNGDPKAGLGGRGGGDVARLLVDELVDPELECPLPTALVTLIGSLCHRDMCFRVLFDWVVATIGAWGRRLAC